MSEIDTLIEQMTSAWRSGNLDKLFLYALKPMLQDHPALYEDIIRKRNDAWMQRLVPLMSRKKAVLVLVGALHLVGEDGLLAQFKKLGFHVEPF